MPGSDVTRTAEYWDREHQEHALVTWMEQPDIRDYINRHFEGLWPMRWFARYLGGRRFRRALSIGCGTGSLERTVIELDIADRVDAFDASLQSLASARQEARTAGVTDRIHYFAADFNRVSLPADTYDLVLFHQSMHHVEKLEALLASVLRTLRPDGLLYVDEYIGPSRVDWNRRLLRPATDAHAALPPQCRAHDELLYPIQPDDPSEGIRSGDILGELRVGFTTEDFRGYGGNILALVYPEVRWDAAPPELLPGLIATDQAVAKRRGPYYAVLVMKPRRGVGRALARLRYGLRLRWFWYELRRFGKPYYLRVKLGIRRRLGYDARW